MLVGPKVTYLTLSFISFEKQTRKINKLYYTVCNEIGFFLWFISPLFPFVFLACLFVIIYLVIMKQSTGLICSAAFGHDRNCFRN